MNETNRPQAKPTLDQTNHESGSLPGMIRQLANDVTSLFTKELALAKSEVVHSVEEAKAGAISMVSGGAVLYAGILVLLAAAVLGLSNVVEPWLAALIVGGIVAIIGFVMVKAGQKKMEPAAFKPERTMESMEKDRQAVRGATS